MRREAPADGEFDELLVGAVDLAQQSDPAEVREIANRPRDQGHAADVARRLAELRIDRDARDLLTAERAASVDPPYLIRLDEFLATPDNPIAHRIECLWPIGGRVLLAAAYKAGKTTMLGNLIGSLVDGTPFLGCFAVAQVNRLVLIDNELDERTLRRWLRAYGVGNADRVSVLALRGKVSSFEILTKPGRARWAEILGPADVLLLDCLRPLLDAFGLKESNEAGLFLVAFDELLAMAGIGEALITHHMGHVTERSRGDSRLRDWPDAEWKLVRDRGRAGHDDDPSAPRYFSAFGRDVEVPERLLEYDDLMRSLSLAGGSRKDEREDDLVRRVVDAVGANPGCAQMHLESTIGAHREDVRRARDTAAKRGLIVAEKNGGRWVHNPVEGAVAHVAQPRPGRADDHSPARPLRGEGSARVRRASCPANEVGEAYL